MARMITQVLAGLMLLFGVLTLLPKSYIELKAGKKAQGVKYLVFAFLAAFFSVMAFALAWHVFKTEILV